MFDLRRGVGNRAADVTAGGFSDGASMRGTFGSEGARARRGLGSRVTPGASFG